jgi:DNA-directed RNA polymerase subunit RPC12/RpoP
MRLDVPAASTTAGITKLILAARGAFFCARIADMTDVERQIRCQRCGADMELRDPGPGMPWAPDQFWVCPKCGRHFWSTYATAAPTKPKTADPVS